MCGANMSTPDPQIGELWIVKREFFRTFVMVFDVNDELSLWEAIKPGDPIIITGIQLWRRHHRPQVLSERDKIVFYHSPTGIRGWMHRRHFKENAEFICEAA